VDPLDSLFNFTTKYWNLPLFWVQIEWIIDTLRFAQMRFAVSDYSKKVQFPNSRRKVYKLIFRLFQYSTVYMHSLIYRKLLRDLTKDICVGRLLWTCEAPSWKVRKTYSCKRMACRNFLNKAHVNNSRILKTVEKGASSYSVIPWSWTFH
jgi:hypothetical protein